MGERNSYGQHFYTAYTLITAVLVWVQFMVLGWIYNVLVDQSESKGV